MSSFFAPSALALAALVFSACAPSAPTTSADHPARVDAPSGSAPVELAALGSAPTPDVPMVLRANGEPPASSHESPDAAHGMPGMAMPGMEHGAGMHAAPPSMASGEMMGMEAGPLPEALDAYLAVQAALANDRLDPVAAQALVVAFDAAAEEAPTGDPHFWHSRAGEVGAARQAAAALAAATELDAARIAFGQLSVPFASLVQQHGVPAGYDLARFTCGMAKGVPEGGVWMQREGELRNPYFGAAMLSCGRRDGAMSPMDGMGQEKTDHDGMDHGGMHHGQPETDEVDHDGHDRP